MPHLRRVRLLLHLSPMSCKVHWLHCHSRWPSKDCEHRGGKQSDGRSESLQGMMMRSCCRPDTVISHHKVQYATSMEVKLRGHMQTDSQHAFIPSNYFEETRRILTCSVILYMLIWRNCSLRDWGKLKPGSIRSHFVLLWLLSLTLPSCSLIKLRIMSMLPIGFWSTGEARVGSGICVLY